MVTPRGLAAGVAACPAADVPEGGIRLRAHRHPHHPATGAPGGLVATGEALSAGRIGLGHASVIGQAITRLGPDVPTAAKTAAETLLLGEAAIHDR